MTHLERGRSMCPRLNPPVNPNCLRSGCRIKHCSVWRHSEIKLTSWIHFNKNNNNITINNNSVNRCLSSRCAAGSPTRSAHWQKPEARRLPHFPSSLLLLFINCTFFLVSFHSKFLPTSVFIVSKDECRVLFWEAWCNRAVTPNR